MTRNRYNSLDAFAAAVRPTLEAQEHPALRNSQQSTDWSGCTWQEAIALARDGWADNLDATLDIAREAITEVASTDHRVTFEMLYDVSGAVVDVERYLSGEPECMVSFPLTTEPHEHQVISLCASIAVSGSVSAETLTRRGQVITAFALRLAELGIGTELYADLTGRPRVVGRQTSHVVLVKGATDLIDPARILFAYAHPGMLRQLGFAAIVKDGFSPVGTTPSPPVKDLPDGTIYLPELLTKSRLPNAADALRDLMRQAGLIHNEDN